MNDRGKGGKRAEEGSLTLLLVVSVMTGGEKC